MALSSRRTRQLGFLALLGIIALMSVQGVVYVSSINRKVESMVAEHQQDLVTVDGLLEEFVEIRGALTSFVINEQTDIRSLRERVSALIESAENVAADFHEPRYTEAVGEFAGEMKKYRQAMIAYSQELIEGGAGEGIRTWEEMLLKTEATAHGIVAEVKSSIRREISSIGSSIVGQGKKARAMNMLLGVSGLFAGLLVAMFLQRALRRPVQSLVDTTAVVASGDLSQDVNVPDDDEIGVLAGSISSMVISLRQLVKGIQSISREVDTTSDGLERLSRESSDGADRQSREIEKSSASISQMDGIIRDITERISTLNASLANSSSAATEMSATTKEISGHADRMFGEVDQIISSVTQVTAAMGETASFLDGLSNSSGQAAEGAKQLTASITQVGEKAKESKNYAEEASRQAKEKGGATLRNMLEVSQKNRELAQEYGSVIETLGERSSSIDSILDVIRDVADQTNLLALNAAIIAAGAGENGRGFDVEAEELRKLSETTTTNVRQINDVLESVRTEVGRAVGLIDRIKAGMDSSAASAEQAGEVLMEIGKVSGSSTEMSADISAAVAEQISACEAILEMVTRNLHEVRRIRRSADEQQEGSRSIVKSVENIRGIAGGLKKGTAEQAAGSEQISQTINKTYQFSQELIEAMETEREASEKMVGSLAHISSVAETSALSSKELDGVIRDLGALADKLSAEMSHFTLPDESEEEGDGE